MNKKLIAGLSFLAGVLTGGTGVYIWARRWINERVNQEMEQFREDMKESKPLSQITKEDLTDGDQAVNEAVNKGKKIFRTQVDRSQRDYGSYFSGPTPDEIAKAARERFNEHMSGREFPQDDEDEENTEGVEEETDEEKEIRELGGIDIYDVNGDYDQLKGVIRQTGDRTYLIDEGVYGEVFVPEHMIWSMVDGKLIDCTDHSYYSDPYRIIGELPAGRFEDGDTIYIRNVALQFDYEITFRNYDYDGYLDSLNP